MLYDALESAAKALREIAGLDLMGASAIAWNAACAAEKVLVSDAREQLLPEDSRAFGAAVKEKWESMTGDEQAEFVISLPYSPILWMEATQRDKRK
jgi:hypothetical protein